MVSITDLKIAVLELSNRTLVLDQHVEKKLIVPKLYNTFFKFNKNVSDT